MKEKEVREMKIVAICDVDEVVLHQSNGGNITGAFEWMHDDGVYLDDYWVLEHNMDFARTAGILQAIVDASEELGEENVKKYILGITE